MRKYRAFISYTHSPDRRLGEAIQRGLRRIAQPRYRSPSISVFRDETSLSATQRLWPNIQQAMEDADFFILLASPRAAASNWVDREAAWWLTNRSEEPPLIALTDGVISWDYKAGDFDWSKTTALPPSFKCRTVYAEVPRWEDFTESELLHSRLSLREDSFRQKIAGLAAPLYGMPKEELVDEDRRLTKRALRLRRSAIAIFLSLAIVAVVVGIQAVKEGKNAREQHIIALSREVAAHATAISNTDPQLAALLSVAASRIADTDEARSSLFYELNRNQQVENFIPPSSESVYGADTSLDGNVVAIASGYKTILWDTKSKSQMSTVFDGGLRVSFGPDGRTLVLAGSDGRLRLWRILQWRPLVSQPLPSPPEVLGFGDFAADKDGRLIALSVNDPSTDSDSSNAKVILWNVERGVEEGSFFDHEVELGTPPIAGTGPFMALSADRERLAAITSKYGHVIVWDTLTGTVIGKFAADSLCTGVAMTPDGSTLLIETSYGVKLWDIATQATVAEIPAGGRTLAISPDGRTLAIGSEQSNIELWDLQNRSRLGVLKGHVARIESLSFSPDGATLTSTAMDNRTIVWKTGSGVLLPSIIERLPFEASLVESLSFASNGDVLAAVELPIPEIWNITRNKREYTLPQAAGDNPIALGPDGRLFAAAEGGRVRVFDPSSGNEVVDLTWPGATGFSALAYSSDGESLSALSDKGLVAWSLNDRKIEASAPFKSAKNFGPYHVMSSAAFSPENRLLALGATIRPHSVDPNDNRVILWNVDQKQEAGELVGDESTPISIAISPDGRLLASSDVEGFIRLWSVSQQVQLAILATSGGNPSLTISPDGRWLVTADSQSHIIKWAISVESWRHQLCEVAGRDLTEAEWEKYLPDQPYRKICL